MHHTTTTTTHHIQSKTVVSSKRQPGSDQKPSDARIATPTLATDSLLNEQHLGCQLKLASAWSFLDFENEYTVGRRFHSSAQVGTKIYLFGGECKIRQPTQSVKKILDDLLVFDVVSCQWSVLDPGSNGGPPGRKGSTMVAHRDSLYVFGGAALSGCFADLWEWKILERRWVNLTFPVIENLAQSPDVEPKTRHKLLAALQDHRYKVHDVARLAGSDLLDRYPQGRAYHVGIAYGDDIIIYGGYGFSREQSALWRYSILEMKWYNLPLLGIRGASERPAHPGIRFGLAACARKNNMFIFGGQQASKLTSPTMWKLDLTTYEWQQLATTGSPPAPRTYAASCVIGSRWFIHGGSSADDVFADSAEFHLDQLHWHPSASLVSNVTLEGHTASCVVTPWDVTTVLLVGGATSGPAVPSGPIMRADFLLPTLEELETVENLRLEDYAIKPVEAATLIWRLAKELHTRPTLGMDAAQIVRKCEELEQIREAAEKERSEVLNRYEDERMQHGDLQSRYRLLERRLVEQESILQTTIQQEHEKHERLLAEIQELKAQLEQLAQSSPMFLKREVVTEIQREVTTKVVNELHEVRVILADLAKSETPDAPVVSAVLERLDNVCQSAYDICATLEDPQGNAITPQKNLTTTLTTDQHTTVVTTTKELKGGLKNKILEAPKLRETPTSTSVENVDTTNDESPTSPNRPVAKISPTNSETAADKTVVGKAADKTTMVDADQQCDKYAEPQAPPLKGINRGVSVKSRINSGSGSARKSKTVAAAPPPVPGIHARVQCGPGTLKLKSSKGHATH